jgi:prophage regulatory protein
MTANQDYLEVTTMQTTQHPTPAYLRLADMKDRYRVSGSTIWKWRKNNGLPAPYKLGANTTVWKLSDLLAWEATRTSAK